MNNAEVLYSRELPGGGYVIIEAVQSTDDAPVELAASAGSAESAVAGDGGSGISPSPSLADAVRGWLRVERRADPARRSGHRPPVVVEATGPTPDLVLHELEPIARDNVEVARAIRRWQVNRPRRGGLT